MSERREVTGLLAGSQTRRAQLTHVVLTVTDPANLAAFYVEHFAMRRLAASRPGRELLAHESLPAARQTSGSFDAAHTAVLELVRSPCAEPHLATFTKRDGYWKIGVTVADVDAYRARLIAAGLAVSTPQQFEDIGYLCHLTDPDTYPIELLDHRMRPPLDTTGTPSLGPTRPRLAHVTLRVRDAQRSLAFYREGLGMTLLSRQRVEKHRFTLFFLACTDETPPEPDLASVNNREWLWQRPYTCLELQHFHGSDDGTDSYRMYHDADHGFRALGFEVPDLRAAIAVDAEQTSIAHDSTLGVDTALISDPDGYRIRLEQRR